MVANRNAKKCAATAAWGVKTGHIDLVSRLGKGSICRTTFALENVHTRIPVLPLTPPRFFIRSFKIKTFPM